VTWNTRGYWILQCSMPCIVVGEKFKQEDNEPGSSASYYK